MFYLLYFIPRINFLMHTTLLLEMITNACDGLACVAACHSRIVMVRRIKYLDPTGGMFEAKEN